MLGKHESSNIRLKALQDRLLYTVDEDNLGTLTNVIIKIPLAVVKVGVDYNLFHLKCLFIGVIGFIDCTFPQCDRKPPSFGKRTGGKKTYISVPGSKYRPAGDS